MGIQHWSSFTDLKPLSGIVLVFDQLDDPQFLRRLVLPYKICEIINPRLLVTKGVEQTALVIGIEIRVRSSSTISNGLPIRPKPSYDGFYVSDLANDFQRIPLDGGRWSSMWINENYIYTTYTRNWIYDKNNLINLQATDVSYDGGQFIFNQFRPGM